MGLIKKLLRNINSLRLKTRLILFVSFLIIIATGFFYYYTMSLQKKLFNESFLQSANNTFETVKFGMEEILNLESYETINKIFSHAKKSEYFDFIVLTINASEILAKYPDSTKISISKLRQLSSQKSLYESVYVISSPYKSKMWSGELFIGFSTKEIRDFERDVISKVSITNTIILLLTVIGIILIATSITKPLENLRKVTERIRKGSLTTRADENKGGFEVISVSKDFNQMISQLTKTQNELQTELSEAALFVFSTLPEPMVSDVNIEWRFIPSRELGGDAFGYHFIDDDNLAVYLIDVAGHGVGAALLSVSVINILRTQSLIDTDFKNPEQVLYSLNQIFQMELISDKFFTIWYGVLNKKSLELKYSCAGHPAGFLVRTSENGSKEIFKLGTINNFIGFLPNINFSGSRFETKKNDNIYIYSDGLSELLNTENTLLSEEEFKDSLLKFDDKSVDELIIYLRSKQKDFTFTDDVSILKIVVQK